MNELVTIYSVRSAEHDPVLITYIWAYYRARKGTSLVFGFLLFPGL